MLKARSCGATGHLTNSVVLSDWCPATASILIRVELVRTSKKILREYIKEMSEPIIEVEDDVFERKLKLTQEYVKAYLEVQTEAKDGSPETDEGRRKSDRRVNS